MFKQAIENITPGTDLQTAMGDYFPVSGYCSRATFEHGGVIACLGG